VMYSL